MRITTTQPKEKETLFTGLPEDEVVIILSPEETAILTVIMGSIGGPPKNPVRLFSSELLAWAGPKYYKGAHKLISKNMHVTDYTEGK